MYIGRQPVLGNFVKLDTITTSATATYNLLNGGVAYSPQSANHCIVSLNGVIQSPTTSFTISGSTIVFASALTSSDVIDFILVLGDVLNIGTPSDNTVSLAKLTATGTKDATTFLRGDNTFASAVSAGQVIQVVNATTTTSTSTTSTSFVTTSLSASITPSSASNKILIMTLGGEFYNQVSGYGTISTIYRNSTDLASASGGISNTWGASSRIIVPASIGIYDTPSSTSSITYSLRIKAESGGTAVHAVNNLLATIILMEIKG